MNYPNLLRERYFENFLAQFLERKRFNYDTGSNSFSRPEVNEFEPVRTQIIYSFQIDDSEEVDQEPEVFQKKKPSRSAR